MHLRKIEKVLTVVARELRRTFPEDFDKRCLYAMAGIRALLKDQGCEVIAYGGDFAAFVVAANNQVAGMQGFGGGIDQCSHFWVEAEGRRLDLGPHFLPKSSTYPAAPMPAVAWDVSEPLPVYLRYMAQLRFGDDAEISQDAAINQRVDDFVAACRARMKAHAGPMDFPTFLLTGHQAVKAAAAHRDLWALGACRFMQMETVENMPF